ncbi:histidine kinase [Fulvivirgaceae bacterium BMA10]|uniref:Histidine kinase n=1 Tax=Splendidivirga corallicola TaxID=3051826 RepID=A0ABT8KPP4_9BACT|nr:histidine kinase [Fulvivirgaceae bacterium BMA10]
MTLVNIEDILLYFSTSIFGQNTEEEIVWDLAKNCISKLGFIDCVVYLVNEDTGMLEQKAAYGPKNPKDYTIYRPMDIPIGQGIVGYVARYGKPEIVKDTSKDERYIVDDEVRLSEIAVPITYKKKVLGVIDSEHPEQDFFTPEHLKILMAIATLCAGKIANARVEKKSRSTQEELIDVQLKMADVKLQALRTQMNPHFMFNALNAIQHFITINDQRKALKYLSKFSRLVRLILENVQTDRLYLSDEIKILHLYLALETMRFDQKFEYEINVPPDSDLMGIKIPFLLVQPFVEKAINRGLVNKADKGQLQVMFHRQKNYLHCIIEDNGIGRQKAKEIVDAKGIRDPSNKLIKRRIAWMNLQSKFKTRLMIKDLYADDNHPAGTRVELEIPLENE